jgi:hypothetical protein
VSEEPSGDVVESPDPEPPGKEIAIREEKTRGTITRWTLGIFAVTVVGSFVGVYLGQVEGVTTILQVLVPLEATLIGGVAGYYLGTGNQA